MGRPLKDPLRALSKTERTELNTLARSRSAPADRIARAKAILAVADGANLQQAIRQANRHSRQALARLIRRFNHDGLSAIKGHHGGGPTVRYGPVQQERIIKEFARTPDRQKDQTATWSLTTLQCALRRAADGLPTISTYVIFQVLHQAGYTWQQNRTWCGTGAVERKRKEGIVTVTDPHTVEKRGPSSRHTL